MKTKVVNEWCSDWYGEYNNSATHNKNPKGPDSGAERVMRGGNWRFYAGFCLVACRDSGYPDNLRNFVGLRLLYAEE